MSEYRPGQLYSGAEGDLLFTILGADGVEFVTNRGTRVPVVVAERVYAPLELIRPVGSEALAPLSEDVRTLAQAIHDALDVPVAAATHAVDRRQEEILRLVRAAHVSGALASLLKGTGTPSAAADAIRNATASSPIAYTPRGQDDAPAGQDTATGLLQAPLLLCTHCNRQIAWEYADWWHTDSDLKECDRDSWTGDYAEPVDDPGVREFASGLQDRLIRVTLKTGEAVTGTVHESADWRVTLLLPLGAPSKTRTVRVEAIRTVQPLEQDGPAAGDGGAE